MSLNPTQFKKTLYHGSSHDFKPGEPILPADVHDGRSNWRGVTNVDGTAAQGHAFATTAESTAWYFARYGHGRSRVHTVAPTRQMRQGAHSELHEYVAPSFERTGTIDIKPGHQGTFPQEDWAQYHKEAGTGAGADSDEVNHPETATIHRPHTALLEAYAEHTPVEAETQSRKMQMHEMQMPLPGMEKPPMRSKEFEIGQIQHLLGPT